jgi:acetyl-CoA carboxylase biotin carboxylase subunit
MMAETQPRLFSRLFIANRGEVAARVARTCDALSIEPVFAVSEADRDAPYTRGRRMVCIGPSRADQSYLAVERVVQAAVQSGCTALHPGWGFLAENPLLPSLCQAHGVTFIGPPPAVMQLMGKKSSAKLAMEAAGLSLILGSDGPVADAGQAAAVGKAVGFPVLLKAESGGGGRGMRVARSAAEVPAAFAEASAEARAAFSDARLYVEQLIERGRHIEVQIMADRYGNVVHLGERDCTVQRNHQKLLEESPAPGLDAEERERTLAAAVRAARSIGYVGAGTFEFLLDDGGTLRFMEMNTRLQVEHPVTEMRSGVDLVAEQIRVAAGHRLSVAQERISLSGHAIECRINAEDPARDFRPSPGQIARWSPPAAAVDLRVDTHVAQGYVVPPHYDSLICKVIARGESRDNAADRLAAALEEMVCEGIPTTVPMHLAILRSEQFRANRYHAGEIPGWRS